MSNNKTGGTRSLQIENIQINDDSECFVIAEIGHNHQGDVKLCRELFQAAKYAGANSVKLQKRDNRSLYTKEFYDSMYNSENAYAPTYGAHREALEFGKPEYQELQEYAKELGLVFFSTAFDVASVDFLEDLDVPAYKVASGDLTNLPLLRYIAKTQKPMIMSTGAGTLDDVRRAHDTIVSINPNLAILQCTATYPSEFTELNLSVISTYREEFPEVVVGYSGHDSGIAMPLIAYMLGARIVEKHFTLNRAMRGTDHAFSLEPPGLRKMVRDLHRTRQALGDGLKQIYPGEISPRRKMGKKIVAATALKAGHVLREADLAYKSPGDGLPPYEAEHLIGKALTQDLVEEQALAFEFVEARDPVTASRSSES